MKTANAEIFLRHITKQEGESEADKLRMRKATTHKDLMEQFTQIIDQDDLEINFQRVLFV